MTQSDCRYDSEMVRDVKVAVWHICRRCMVRIHMSWRGFVMVGVVTRMVSNGVVDSSIPKACHEIFSLWCSMV